jgi:hypothetical protein
MVRQNNFYSNHLTELIKNEKYSLHNNSDFFPGTCASSQDKRIVEEKQYTIAYNIHENDTIHKNNDEDGGFKQKTVLIILILYRLTMHIKIVYFYQRQRCFFLYETNVNETNIKKISDLRLEDR